MAIPIEARLAVLFVLGSSAGSLVNLAIYGLSSRPRPITPWSRPHPKAPPRRFCDRLPIVGWLGLRRESHLHGTGFWIRPMLLEGLTGIGFAVLYWWEIGNLGLLPPGIPRQIAANWMGVLHAQYAAHLVLICWMLAASMIDADEKIIPDTITVPGTLIGLLLAAAVPCSLLPDLVVLPGRPISLCSLNLTSPNPWPAWLDGAPQACSLLIGLGCWWLWCVALMPRSWYPRHGWPRALKLSLARLVRDRATYRILVMGLIGTAAIAAAWFCGGPPWTGLLTALVGMAAAGGLVWMVRIIGTAALRREAMGFGDVTLMAMIGTFLGWQTCLIIFFIAPLAGLVVGVFRVIFFRDTEIPYGPFLCLAAATVIVGWAAVWDRAWGIFAMGWIVPLIVLICLALMAVMLRSWTAVRDVFR